MSFEIVDAWRGGVLPGLLRVILESDWRRARQTNNEENLEEKPGGKPGEEPGEEFFQSSKESVILWGPEVAEPRPSSSPEKDRF
jgi:hypothetical protein